MQPYVDDLEKDDLIKEQIPTYIRHSFIRRVYALLCIQLLFTGGFTLLSIVYDFTWVQDPRIVIVSYISAFPIVCCIPAVKKKHPWNVFLLMIFTACMSIITANSVKQLNNPAIVLEAFAITAALFLCLTIFTLQTKINFSFLGTWLFVSIISLLIISIIQFFFVVSIWIHMILSWIGIIVFSGYILYDTSVIIHYFSPDDAIDACLNLYLDVLNIFFIILNILSSND